MLKGWILMKNCCFGLQLNANEICVSNSGQTTQYFKLLCGAGLGDPIAAYFVIIVLDIFFIMLCENNNINKRNIFGVEFLLRA